MKQVTLKNDAITLKVLDYGALVQELWVMDNSGKKRNVVIGFENAADYLTDEYCLGASVGRFAGRISKGKFELDGTSYSLHNDDGVHLHGGKEGFHKKYWTITEVNENENPFVKLTYRSKHLEEGYPGNLEVSVTYQLTQNKLNIGYTAITDKKTVVNLTNHSYFRLDDAPTIGQHELQLNCPYYLKTHENLLPTGEIMPVDNTPYDFRGQRPIATPFLDTPFAIDHKAEYAAILKSAKSGISMKVKTNQPAVVVFTPVPFAGICFETQNYPDAPNYPHFPSSILEPGKTYSNESQFVFENDI
ncbi:aldose epimerase family protein [Allomuricauda sp. SCSIO 65647]|uniref:aldose epimerase family protein n=1 Tax=Allomuricauda sp. SCSIO 65647 TaxID=2908843 RepID=UPI001F34B5AE|nr:aldose epimerase family protein [Muricauda sp. SCSIO 65647]UJH66847.1 galactose mutarotase [Muricauda sp. SCSIO 65647]